MIRAVFFDVGGTLLHPHPSVGAIYADVAQRHGVTLPPDHLNKRFSQVWKEKKKERSAVDRNWWRSVVTDIFEGSVFPEPDKFFDDLYAAFGHPRVWRVYPDVISTLTELRRRKLQLAVVSNWDERLPALLAGLGLSSFFDRQFISFEVGKVKPDPEIFRIALRELGLDPMEAVHVGDDAEEDVAAAERAGMRAYLINRVARPLNSRSLSDLTEILLRV